jgi:acetyltransferase-like isoleucine patch superfamily enzyme
MRDTDLREPWAGRVQVKQGERVATLRSALSRAYYAALRCLRQPIYTLRHCRVDFSCRIGPGCVLVDTTIGPHTYVGGGVLMTATQMGNYCSIASGSKIGGMEHAWWRGSTSPRLGAQRLSTNPTVVEDDVWIGANAVLRQGVRIGRGAVVGAGAVVLRDVAPYTIVAGVPAREIRKRFPDDIVQQVLATRFWEHPPERARQLLQAIDFPEAPR